MNNRLSGAVIYDYLALPQSTFTVVAATDVFTSGAAHGFTIGDKLQFTTATTLPAGLELLTNYYIISTPSTTTFKVSATPGGTTVNVTDTGTGTHTYHLKGRMIYVGDWKNVHFSLNFVTTPTLTIKFQGSDQLADVDCSLSQSATNRWDYLDVYDEQNGTSIDGDTGVACTGTADNRVFTLTTAGKEWVSVDCTAYTQGTIGIVVSAYSD